MHQRMIRTIFRKDLRDAIRDGRVLLAVLFPVGLGIFYNLVFDEEISRPSATVAYAAAETSRLPALLREVAGGTVELTVTQAASAAAVERLVADEEADIGLVLPIGFDAAVERGEAPRLAVVLPPSPSFGGDYVAAALEETLRRLAGQRPPATVERVAVAPAAEDELIFDRLGAAPYFVITNVLFLIVMVALFAVPVILAEEAEQKTLDALVMIASYADVVVAKALVGLVYIAVAIALLLGLTQTALADVPGFVATTLLLSVALIGIGLLLGGLFRSATQLNTWSSLILIPFAGPIFAVGLPVPAAVDALLTALPTSQGTRLAINALTGDPVFGNAWLSYLVIAAWGALAYLLVLWRLSQREG